MYILGIESSCDETAAAIVDENKRVLANIVYSQLEEHKVFGGVVPEIAARAHLEKIDIVVEKALQGAAIDVHDLTAVAGTCGPGLIGGVVVGATFAKALSMSLDIPFIAINHIEAHALSIRLTEDLSFPYLLFLASGGHCQICVVHDIDNFEILGRTLDDSIGESFDKVSKLLGYGYPGGPLIEKNAKSGDPEKFSLPHPLCARGSMDFSFSGLKTAVLVAAQKCQTDKERLDLCAGFQNAVAEVVRYKMEQALKHCRNTLLSGVVIGGGVAANEYIRGCLKKTCEKYGIEFFAPPVKFCTDNGAMIAWNGVEKYQKHQFDSLKFKPIPRWDLGRKFV